MKQEEKTKLTREKIIAAGILEFGSKGYKQASINNISGAGIAKGLIYHNFHSKDELYIACLGKCFDEMTERLSAVEITGDHNAYFRARADFFARKKNEAAMVLEALTDPPEKHHEKIKEIRRPYDEMNTERIKAILCGKQLRSGVDMDSAVSYFALMQDMYNLYCCRSDIRSPEDRITFHEKNLPGLFEYMLYGVLKGEGNDDNN
ncbi:MAG: TetR/AcrR family transcriptional regulator [Huintestinicola sp.]|uniref:TetR/AcrR family transcriptional regulator n=1 Tax=Huintestinicola sp. TaxID=2981661 RepID=UPI003F0DF0D5